MRFVVEIGREWVWDELPPRTIALDGAVAGPRIDAEGKRYSFDHHASCVRLATAATCRQVLDALLLGLAPSEFTVLLNDVDADSALAAWLLARRDVALAADALPRTRAVVAAVAEADAHGPAYPLENPGLLFGCLDALASARAARAAGYPQGGDAALSAALRGLDAWWAAGAPEAVPHDGSGTCSAAPCEDAGASAGESREALDLAPQIEDRGAWSLVRANGGAGRTDGATALYASGRTRLVFVAPLGDGRWRYSLAKRSDLVGGFPLRRLYAALNAAEATARGATLGPGQTWGGGSSVGGGPRDGSVLPPARVAAVVDDVMGCGAPRRSRQRAAPLNAARTLRLGSPRRPLCRMAVDSPASRARALRPRSPRRPRCGMAVDSPASREAVSETGPSRPLPEGRSVVHTKRPRGKRHAALRRALLRYLPDLRRRQEALPRSLTARVPSFVLHRAL